VSHRAAYLRTAVALATAGPLTLLAAGCITQTAPPVEGPAAVKGKTAKGGSAAIDARLRAGVKTAIAYTSREDRMAVMTEAFSLSRNKGLQKASESFKSLGSSLSGLQALTSATSRSASAGSLRYRVEGGPTLHVVGSRAGYALAGLAEYEQGDTVIVYDDQTKEVTAVRSADAELRFKLDKRGDARSWTSEIARSPDGTTGLLSVEVSSRAWKTYELPQPQAPWVCTYPSPSPRPQPPRGSSAARSAVAGSTTPRRPGPPAGRPARVP
jgi:hypothetical protein